MADIGELVKWGAIAAGVCVGGFILYKVLGKVGLVHLQNTAPDEAGVLAQTIDTRGNQLVASPRTTFFLGNGGSVSEISRLPENHGRGEAVLPEWRRWEGTFGGIYQDPASPLSPLFSEEYHVTPALEARLAQSLENRLWEQGGAQPVTGTFG